MGTETYGYLLHTAFHCIRLCHVHFSPVDPINNGCFCLQNIKMCHIRKTIQRILYNELVCINGFLNRVKTRLAQMQHYKDAGRKKDMGACSSTLILSNRHSPVPNADLVVRSDAAILHSILPSLYPFSLPCLQWGQMDL